MTTSENATPLPITEAQRGIWVAQQIDPLSPRYNCGGYLEITGEPSFETLSRAIDAALAECEALRVNFVCNDSNPGQTVCPVAPNTLEFVDLRKSDDAEQLAVSIMSEDLSIARNLLAAGLIRQMLFVLPDSRCFYYLRYHHILMDGYGQIVYWRRVAELYSAFSTGAEPPPAPARTLAAILEADAAYMASAAREGDRRAWADKLRDLPPPVDLGGRANGLARARLRRSVALPTPLVDKLHARSSRSRSRWSPIMLAAVAAYVRTLVPGDDVVLSLPVPARIGAAALGTPAMLANELPLRLQVGLEQTFDELVAHVTSSVGFVLEHQRYRGEALQRELASSARSGRIGAPVVNLITFDRPVTFGTCPASPHYLSSGPVDDLLVGCYGRMDGVNIDLVFDANPERYSPEDVARHQTRFLHVLDALLSADIRAPLGAIDLLLPAERARIDRWNATQRPFDLTGSLHRLIEGQARRIPDAVAAINGTSQLTYRQLDEQASRLAAHLLALGVAPGDRVGVAEYRSLEMPVALLAILKAGAAYVPLDPDQPADRTAFQIDDAAVRVVLTRSTLRERFAALDAPTLVCVDAVLPGLPAPVSPLPDVGPDAAAYVIYTSGSTGRPKGVAVPHRGVVNRLLWMQEQYRLTADDCVLQKTPYTFDVSVWEFFWPLIAGSRIVFAEPGAHRDPRRIGALIDAHRVTTIHFVPPMLDLFLEELNAGEAGSLRRVICSGEALRAETVGAFFRAFPPASGVELHNLYGPTEASIDVSHWRCGPGDADGLVPIGAPVANTQLHVLDTAGRPVPVGSTGELFIGGVQVALGYLNRPELNARCFVDDPFRAGGTLYRTGDLARWRSDGAIEFLGRIDQQVKIRGFRVEPGEIESALLAHPDVRQAVVGTWRVRDGETRLIAHVVMRDDTPLAHGEMVAHLGARLPEYMIPQHLMTLRALPLSRNGKIDRGALPMPDSDAPLPSSGAAHFDTAAERLLAEVWRELLGAAAQLAEQSFFSLGGDSMLAIRMRSHVERAGMTFDIQDVFQYPTLRALATRLRPHGGAVAPARLAPFALLAQADRARLPTGVVDAYPVAAMQGGMLYHAELDAQSSVYRVVTSLRMAARFDVALLRRSIDATVARHPLLRTGFDLSSFSEPLQLVYGGASAPIAVVDATDDSTAAFEARVSDWVADAKHHCFDVSKPPLMTFAVHLRDADCFQLSVIEHHAILDGWSDAAMLQEIVDRYAAALDGQELWLPALPSAYADFVAEERRVSADSAASEYWRSRLLEAEHTGLPRRALPCAAAGGSRHRGFEVPLAADSLAGLQSLAREAGLPLKSLLTAVHVAVLGLVAGWARVSTGLVVNGRLEHEGGDAVLGVFLNTLPLSIDASGLSFVAIARAAFEFERDSAPYRRYPFGAIQQVAGGLELDSYVNFIDFHAMWRQRGADGALIRDAVGVAETNYPLAANFLVDPIGGQLRAWLDCDVTQLDEAFCEQMAGYYARGVAALLATPEARVDEVELIGPDEVAQLASWNDTYLEYDVEATIHGAFELHAAERPGAIALVHRDREIGYGELDARANRLARHLVADGLAPGLLVGISLPRGIDMVVAMLAVMKSGCAYVPLDPDYPHDRLRFISEDAGLACLIADSTSSLVGLVPGAVLMDRDDALLSAGRSTSPACPVGSDAAAYVIYTSGSTGRPKG
ncbi:non-ribosomal peptide synthetase, partial [Burkholderia glumae]